MSSSGDLLIAAFSLARIIAVLVALWLALRYEPRVASFLKGIQAPSPSLAARAVIWFALGAILAIPLVDLVGFIRMLVEITSPESWGLFNGTVSTFWGSAPNRVFNVLSGATTLAIYAAASHFVWRHLSSQRAPHLAALASSKIDRILITASLAGLVNFIVISILVGVVFVQLPFSVSPLGVGAIGLVAGWLLGFGFVVVLAGVFSLRMQRALHEI
jgi:hypothetical protein